jgi:hypothetical protein
LLGLIVVERDPQVMGESEVVVAGGEHPGGEGAALALELAAEGGVDGDPGFGCLAEPAGLLVQELRVDGAVPGSAGGVRSLFQGEEGVDGLLGPDDVVFGAGLGDRGQFT